MQKVVQWLSDQAGKAKVAWTVICLLGASLGYQLTATKVEPKEDETDVSVRIQMVQEQIKALTEAIKNNKVLNDSQKNNGVVYK